MLWRVFSTSLMAQDWDLPFQEILKNCTLTYKNEVRYPGKKFLSHENQQKLKYLRDLLQATPIVHSDHRRSHFNHNVIACSKEEANKLFKKLHTEFNDEKCEENYIEKLFKEGKVKDIELAVRRYDKSIRTTLKTGFVVMILK